MLVETLDDWTGLSRDPFAQPRGGDVAVEAGARHAGPEGHRFGAQHGAHVHRALEEGDAPRAAFGRIGQQRRLVLLARVEQEARAGLDHRAEAPGREVARQGLRAALPAFFERVEVVVVQRQRHAVVPDVGDQRDRVAQAVVRRAVGVVGVAQRRPHAAPFRCSSRSWAEKGPLSR